MRPTNNWDRTQAQTGEQERLTAGGHIVRIHSAECRQSKAGREMLVLSFDINEGSPFDGMMQRRFRAFGKWPTQGMYYQLLTDKDGNTNPRFKGLISVIEHSNNGFQWAWDENALRGKQLGMIFGEEEYISQRDGSLGVTVKARFFCSADEALGHAVPPLKKLEESDVNGSVTGGGQSYSNGSTFTQVDDDELPF